MWMTGQYSDDTVTSIGRNKVKNQSQPSIYQLSKNFFYSLTVFKIETKGMKFPHACVLYLLDWAS
jgi:hypothetical protein